MVQRTVGILIFDEVEVLDFCGPFEVFSSAYDEAVERCYRVQIIAASERLIECRGGLFVQPHASIVDQPKIDLLLVPGGYGTRREVDNPTVIDWITDQTKRVELTTSVCTGAFLLAKTGILDGKRATTHWATIEDLRR